MDGELCISFSRLLVVSVMFGHADVKGHSYNDELSFYYSCEVRISQRRFFGINCVFR